MKTTNQEKLNANAIPARPMAPLSQVDELRAAEMMSHGFGNTQRAEAGRRARRRAAAGCFRADLVQRVRMEIADGAYPIDEKLDVAVERLYLALVRSVECTLERKAAG
jgi:hypothetical protein